VKNRKKATPLSAETSPLSSSPDQEQVTRALDTLEQSDQALSLSYSEEIERRSEADREGYRKIQARIMDLLSPIIEPQGFEIVELEVHTHRQKLLRLYIDRLEPTPTDGSTGSTSKRSVSIDDCATVSRALNEPLDTLPELEAIFKGAYELEVSSPGVDRPLRNPRDFLRFVGRRVRVHLARPLTAIESGNAEFTRKHPRQISFLGKLEGLENDQVTLSVTKDEGNSPSLSGSGSRKASAPRPGKKKKEEVLPRVAIPLALISKANLDPEFDFSVSEEDEVIVL